MRKQSVSHRQSVTLCKSLDQSTEIKIKSEYFVNEDGATYTIKIYYLSSVKKKKQTNKKNKVVELVGGSKPDYAAVC